MALDKATLKSNIAAAFAETATKTEDPQQAYELLAGKIADAIDQYVKELTIVYVAGLTAPNGPVGGNFTYELS